MNVRRITAAGLATTVALGMLAACSSGDDGAAPTSGAASSPGAAAGVTMITFWNSYTSSDRPAVEELVRRFNESQDQYKVDMTIQPNDVLSDTLLPAYNAGQGPTIVTIDASLVPAYVEQGVFQPVDDFYDGAVSADVLPKASLDATTYDGKQWGVPFGATPTMLYWNKTLFAEAGITEPPATMDEMAEDAVKLTDASKGQYGIAIPDREAPSTWAVLLWANGGGIVSEDRTHSVFGDPASVEAVEKWSGLMRNEGISPIGMNGVEGDTLFGAGKAAMLINGPWASTGFKDGGIDFGIAPVPAGKATQTSVAISTNVHLNAKATEAEKAAAYAFLEFWNSVESQTYWAVQTGYPPNRSDIDPSTLSENPTAQAYAAKTNSQFYLGGLAKYAQIDSDVVIPTIQRITNGEGDTAQLMQDASKQIDALLG